MEDLHSDEPLLAQVSRRNPSGYRVQIGDTAAFLPMSLVPEQHKTNTEFFIGMIFECEVIWDDGTHPPVVRPIGPFISIDEWSQKARRGT